MIRVALVDDQAIVRAGLARILSPADGFEVVAECADGRQAVTELPALRPDIVLMDIRMPVLDGIDESPDGGAAMYGMVGQMPDQSSIDAFLVEFLDVLYEL